jgi:hypothetical protein
MRRVSAYAILFTVLFFGIRTGLRLKLKAQANPPSISIVQLQGIVDRVIPGPHERVEGIVLKDHTFVKVPPCALRGTISLRPGDPVSIAGNQLISAPNRVIDHAVVRHGDQLVFSPDKVISGRPGPQAQQCAGELSPENATFKSMKDQAALQAVSVGANRQVNHLILDDGTWVQVLPGGFIRPDSIKIGQKIFVQGFGEGVPNGKVIYGMKITADGSSSQLITASGVNGEKWAEKQDKVKQALLTPNGEVDGVLLSDGSSVRFPPASLDQAKLLTKGTSVSAAGPEAQSQVRTPFLMVSKGQRVLYFPPTAQKAGSTPGTGPNSDFQGPPGMVPDNANEIAVKAPVWNPPAKDLSALKPMNVAHAGVQALLRAPDGSVDKVVLGDGTVVTVPPNSTGVVPPSLKEGNAIAVMGKGGKYPLGTAIQAESIKLS